MTNTAALIADAYSAFNRRDIDGTLALMSENVSWPRPSEGGRAVGKEEIRAYWTRQWQQVNPHVDPLEILDEGAGRVRVRVHQVVRDLAGALLLDTEVWHIYTVVNGLIERMDIEGSEAASQQSPA